jgi:phage/plasmid-like protein (TIGR03299 family)
MAHNLMFDEETQQHAMFVVGERDAAWHKLGQRVDSAVSWESAMELAGLDWTVKKHQLLGPDARPIEAWGIFKEPNREFLGAVGGQYTAIQNRYAFDFVDTLLEAENGSHYDSAGALGNGERIWVSAKVPYSISIRGTDDLTETYLIFATSHDGSMAATGKLSTVRVVCNNTLTSALNGSGSFVRVKHTPDAERRLSQAKRLMSGVSQSVKTLEEKFNL